MRKHPVRPGSPTLSKPFLKWAGGKQRLLSQILPLLPAGNQLIEPFVGAGAVFLASAYNRYVINDANPDLVAVWVALQSRPAQFMNRAAAHFTEKNRSADAYYELRDLFNAHTDSFERAVLLPYLNRFGFNGLFRVNSRGHYNIPYGKPMMLPHFPWEEMEVASRKLRRCLVLNGGYQAAIEMATEGDVVYCDPPYVNDVTPSFTQYTASPFGIEQHRQLEGACREAARRGATVLVSNHDTATTRSLYAAWEIIPVTVRRSLSAQTQARGVVNELIARLHPLT
jgi:DNA adenine methylase